MAAAKIAMAVIAGIARRILSFSEPNRSVQKDTIDATATAAKVTHAGNSTMTIHETLFGSSESKSSAGISRHNGQRDQILNAVASVSFSRAERLKIKNIPATASTSAIQPSSIGNF